MGFNNSATTTTLQVHLTDYGRRLLFQGSLGDNIKTFHIRGIVIETIVMLKI